MTGEIIRRLVAVLGLDVNEDDFDKAEKNISRVKTAIGAAVGLFVGSKMAQGFRDIVMGAVEAADQLENTASRLGVSTTALQELGYAAELSNLGQDELAQNLQFLARNASEATSGNKSAAKAFRELGVSVRGANGEILPADELVARVADGMSGLSNDADRVRLSMEIFGRSGARMVPMLKNGSAGLQGMGEELRELGGFMDEEFIAKGVEVDDNLVRMRRSMQGLRNMIAVEVLPAVNRALMVFIGLWKRARAALEGTAIVKVLLWGLVGAASAAAFVMGTKLISALGGVAHMGLKAALGIGAAEKGATLMQLKALALGGIFLLLIGLLVLITDEIVTAFQGGRTVFGLFAKSIEDWYDRVMSWKGDGSFIDWLIKPLQGLLWILNEVKKQFYALIMLATGDFSGFKMIAEDLANKLPDDSFLKKAATALGGLVIGGDASLVPGGSSSGATVTPSAGALASSSGVVNAPNVTLNQTVVAGPGQSPEAVGAAAGQSASAEISSMLDRTLLDLTPAMTMAR